MTMTTNATPAISASTLEIAKNVGAIDPAENNAAGSESVSEAPAVETTPAVETITKRRRGRARKSTEPVVEECVESPPETLLPSALADIFDALQPLSAEQRKRVLAAVGVLLGG